MAVYRLGGWRVESLWSGGRRIVLLGRIDGAEALRTVGRVGVRLARRDMANGNGIGLLVVLRSSMVHVVEGSRKGGVLILLRGLDGGLLSFLCL
jgi:hypothetical protein